MFLRVVSGVMTLVFLLSVAVQYNDPDAIVWMAIYGAAAILSALAAWKPDRPDGRAAALVAVIATLWGAWLLVGVAGRVNWGLSVMDYHMKAPASEQARESIGLGLVAAWCALLAVARWPRRRA